MEAVVERFRDRRGRYISVDDPTLATRTCNGEVDWTTHRRIIDLKADDLYRAIRIVVLGPGVAD